MNFTNRLFHLLIGICFLSNTIPSTIKHVFGENHKHDSHVCDSDFCFQEKEVDCETIDLAENKKFAHFPKNDYSIILSELSFQEYNCSPCSFRLSKDIRLRGPPINV